MRLKSPRFLTRAAFAVAVATLAGTAAKGSTPKTRSLSRTPKASTSRATRTTIFATSSLPRAAPHILNNISWIGDVSAQEDPAEPGAFPTWGNELSVRVTHDPTGHFADFQLGQNAFFFDDTYAGNQYSLYGTRVSPGDGLSFEFFEDLSDFENLADAIWSEITFDLAAIADPDPLPLAAGTIRIDASGRDSWPSNVILTGGPDGDINYGDFWGVEYAAGTEGPSITQIDIRLSESGQLYFNPDQIFGQLILDGDTSAGIDGTVGIVFDEQGVQLSDSFSLLSLTFDPGDFTAGDNIRFGVDIDASGIAQDDSEGFVDLNNNLYGGEIPGTRRRNSLMRE